MTDRIVLFGVYENLVGILSEGVPQKNICNKAAIIILNAGTIYRVGPNRIYLKLARRLSEQGFNVLRFDFSGIGDSENRPDNLPFNKSAPKEVASAMDYLCKTLGTEHFILIGHCSGVAVSIQTALDDQRVVGEILVNPHTPNSQKGQELNLYAYHWHKAIIRPQSWIKLILGKSDYRQILKSFINKMFDFKLRQPKFEADEIDFANFLKTAFQQMLNRRIKFLFITSGVEIGINYYQRIIGKEIKAFIKNDLLDIKSIAEADHTFTPLASQNRLFFVIQEWIQKFEL